MIKVYGMSLSGNCHKVRMVLEALHLPYAWTEIDPSKGETRTPEFLARNPNGKVPVVELEPGVYLPESNAIICYLADASPLMPADRLLRARVLACLPGVLRARNATAPVPSAESPVFLLFQSAHSARWPMRGPRKTKTAWS